MFSFNERKFYYSSFSLNASWFFITSFSSTSGNFRIGLTCVLKKLLLFREPSHFELRLHLRGMWSGVARFLKCKLIYLGGILMSPIPSYSDLFQAKLMSVHSCNKIIQNLCHLSSLSLSTVETVTSPDFLAQTTLHTTCHSSYNRLFHELVAR